MFLEVSITAAKAARRGRRGRNRTKSSLRLRSARRGGAGLFRRPLSGRLDDLRGGAGKNRARTWKAKPTQKAARGTRLLID